MNRLARWKWIAAMCLLPLIACEKEDPVLAAAKAAWSGDTQALEKALSKGVSPDALQDGHSLLRITMEGHGGIDSADVLLSHGAHVNMADEGGWTALMEAAEGGPLDRVEYLLRKGADPNLEDQQGSTALFHLNSSNGDGAYALGTAHMLVMAGADPCHRNKAGKQAEESEATKPTAARLYLIEACRKKNGNDQAVTGSGEPGAPAGHKADK